VYAHAADGRIQLSSRPGNARGNGLSTNAAPPRAWPITQYTWADEGAAASVRVPLAPLAAGGTLAKGALPVAQRVRAAFAERSFELEVTDEAGSLYRLRVAELPGGGLEPQARAASVHALACWVLTAQSPATRRADTAWRARAPMPQSC
jgi:hypothetical protein